MGEQLARPTILAELSLEEVSTLAKTGDGDEIETCIEKISTFIKRLEESLKKNKGNNDRRRRGVRKNNKVV